LNWGKFFQPLFLHWSLLVGNGWASDEVKVSVKTASPVEVNPLTVAVPSSWKFPSGVWMVAVYGTLAVKSMREPQPWLNCDPHLLPVIVVVPEVIVNVALKLLGVQPPVSVNPPG
jgi:hypothetical protein